MLELKKASINDAKIIAGIKIEAFNKEINTYLGRNGGPPGYDKVESQIHIIQNFIAYKIELDNEIIGAFFLIPLEDNKMCFEDFVIKPLFQGKGYGYRAMELAQKAYSQIKEWQLYTPVFSIGNQHLYEKFGYIEVLRNEDEIEYIKKINLL
jgi:GNAT superfamily N-acetyltransferase